MTGQVEEPTVIGPDGEPMVARWLTLGVEKFDPPGGKYFRLIWIYQGEAWLAEEDTRQFRRKYGPDGVIEAGKGLVEKVRALGFSEVTR